MLNFCHSLIPLPFDGPRAEALRTIFTPRLAKDNFAFLDSPSGSSREIVNYSLWLPNAILVFDLHHEGELDAGVLENSVSHSVGELCDAHVSCLIDVSNHLVLFLPSRLFGTPI
jgi:hypothetical protein